MKYFVITDSTDTQVGLRLAGIEGVVVREEPLVRAAIQTAAADPDIAVLLITEKLAALCQDLIAPLKLTAQRPLVVEIPDRHSASRAPTPSPATSGRPLESSSDQLREEVNYA